MGRQGWKLRLVFQLADGLWIAGAGGGFEVGPARGGEVALPFHPVERELRLGEGNQPFGEAFIKVARSMDTASTCALMCGFDLMSWRASSSV